MLLNSGPVATNIIARDSFSCRDATPSILRHGYPFYRLAAGVRVHHLFGRPCDIQHMADCVGNRTGLRSIDCCAMFGLDMPVNLRGNYCESAPFTNYYLTLWAMYKQFVKLLHGGHEVWRTCMGTGLIHGTI